MSIQPNQNMSSRQVVTGFPNLQSVRRSKGPNSKEPLKLAQGIEAFPYPRGTRNETPGFDKLPCDPNPAVKEKSCRACYVGDSWRFLNHFVPEMFATPSEKGRRIVTNCEKTKLQSRLSVSNFCMQTTGRFSCRPRQHENRIA